MRIKAQLLLICVLSIFYSHLSAHMLNMSDISLNLSGSEVSEMVLRIDLGQSLMRAASLDSIKNPLTPQMAELTFELKVPEKIENLEIKLSNNLDIPWPCLVRIDGQ